MSWPKECNDAINKTIGMFPMLVLKVSHNQNVMSHLILTVMTEEMHWCYWQHYWHHMMAGLLPVVSHDKMSYCTSFTPSWCVSNAMVPLMVLSTPHDADTNKVDSHYTNTSGIMWCQCWCQWYHMTKISCCTYFPLHLLKECNGAIDDDVCIVWHWWLYQWDQMTKRSCSSSLPLSWPKEHNFANHASIGIMWCQHHCQCCTSFWLSWLNKNSSAIDDADAGASSTTWPKSHVISHW